ncbi:MAG: iron-regulated protein [Rhizobacter sp.]|nr:iron-regulated protein [Rhizobacter sp.]
MWALVLGAACAPARAQADLSTAAGPVLAHYAQQVQATYADTLARTLVMRDAVQRLLAAPSPDTLAAAREAWLQARERYALTEAFRFYGGPIDGASGPEPRINSWPVDESFIDGLIAGHDADLLTKASLAALNQRDGEENVATGWHAIEYLLWGPDRSEAGPGDRPPTDYVPGAAPLAQQRANYLRLVTDLLVDDLSTVARAWAPEAPNYRREFEHGGLASVRRIVLGLGTLSRAELAGERMEVALATQDQEDEQSCFSDNTHRDLVGNARGIDFVWRGHYVADDGRVLQGPSLRDLVALRDVALAERITTRIAASVAAAEALQPPFDREVVGGREAPGRLRVRRAIDSVVAQATGLVEAARVLGLAPLQGGRRP